MDKILVNVYGENGEFVKTSEAKIIDLKFGSIRSLMKLLNVEGIDNTLDLMNTIYEAWEQLTKILSECFPDIEESDWDNVELRELVPAIVAVLKASFSKILEIPKDPKN